jgi:hypothetical protein
MMSNIITNLIAFEIFASEHECLCIHMHSCVHTHASTYMKCVIPRQLGHDEIGHRAKI